MMGRRLAVDIPSARSDALFSLAVLLSLASVFVRMNIA